MGTISIEVIYALPYAQTSKQLRVPSDCTVAEAIHLSGLLHQFPEIDAMHNKFGIFGQVVAADQQVAPHDRVEIYRKLIIDPKEARRIRAKRVARTGK